METVGFVESKSSAEPEHLIPLNMIWRILIIVSLVLIAGTALLRLDFLPATLLGSTVVGLNFYWTRRIVLKVFYKENIKWRMFLVYVFKFGLSAIVLYVALAYFQLSPIGLLIGLSNIVLTMLIYSVVSIFHP